ncbi:hypothetical protein BDR04DRAFT_1113084 [Suillus decipiens]|nr:hypothetical protein BDR04DRAFT_1113084 [Suillus decipiens]
MPLLTKFCLLPIPTPKTFKAKLLEGWLELWPEKDVLWPNLELDLELTEMQKKELFSAEKEHQEMLGAMGLMMVTVSKLNLKCLEMALAMLLLNDWPLNDHGVPNFRLLNRTSVFKQQIPSLNLIKIEADGSHDTHNLSCLHTSYSPPKISTGLEFRSSQYVELCSL